ncbi:MAG TPA: thiamine phosphate synthase [Phycisphaerae bacterium]|nr:thiamine phosphate synthase [Phycisphaerae bacterium]
MREIYRILDANFNRAREAIRVAEDCGRFAFNDPAITAMAKNLRSDMRDVLRHMPEEQFIVSRDTPGDIGTELTSPSEQRRDGLPDVAMAACKRLAEALRTIEEYSKVVAPSETIKIERMRYNAYTLEQRLSERISVGSRFADVRLYAMLWSRLCPGSLRETARAAVSGGADAIQLREKDIPDDQFLAMAAELRELADETGRIFIVNDRPDIAAIVGADGVHLGQNDLPIAEARTLLRPGAVVGRSTHNIQQVRAAITEGADYISVGPMFPTSTKDAGPVAGPRLLKQAVKESSVPVVCIGGIDSSNIRRLVTAGARCVAICSAICSARNPRRACELLKKQIEKGPGRATKTAKASKPSKFKAGPRKAARKTSRKRAK